jgi:hypothetical protein
LPLTALITTQIQRQLVVVRANLLFKKPKNAQRRRNYQKAEQRHFNKVLHIINSVYYLGINSAIIHMFAQIKYALLAESNLFNKILVKNNNRNILAINHI